MFLYSLTIQPPTNVVQAVLGQFAGTKEQLIITGAGSRLTLLRPDPSQGKVITLLSHDIFGIIRSLAAFRLAGSNKGEFYLAPIFLEGHIVMVKILQSFETHPANPIRLNGVRLRYFSSNGLIFMLQIT
jgi:hypothetical protein